MNLESNPSIEQLAAMFARCNDHAGHHILWVDDAANVHITQLDEDMTPAGFSESRKDIKLRYETYSAGNGYVGFKAAHDKAYIEDIFESLKGDWTKFKGVRGERYID